MATSKTTRKEWMSVVLLILLLGQASFLSVDFRDLAKDIVASTTGMFTTDETVPQRLSPKNWTHEWLVNGTKGEPVRILFLHVGKAGGIGLDATMRAQIMKKWKALDCFQRAFKSGQNRNGTNVTIEQAWGECYEMPPVGWATAFGNHILSHKHMNSPGFSASGLHFALWDVANTFLYVVRNPVDRIVSTFNYHRYNIVEMQYNFDSKPFSKKFYKCFETISDVAQALIGTPLYESASHSYPKRIVGGQYLGQIRNATAVRRVTEADNCTAIAQVVMQGDNPPYQLNHFLYNYKYYWDYASGQRPEVPVIVVRNKHMANDTHRIDKVLGGAGNFSEKKRSHGSEKFQVKTGINTTAGKVAICCFIWRDLDAYQSIVLAALNLNDTEKRETLQLVFDDCNVTEVNSNHVTFPFSWGLWRNKTCP